MSIQNIPYLENGMFLQDFPQKHSTSLIWKIECFAGFSPKHSITNIPFKFHVHAGFHLIRDRLQLSILNLSELGRMISLMERFFHAYICVPSRNENKNQFDGAKLKAEQITMSDL